MSAALAQLLEHPDETVRAATRHAIMTAMSTPETEAESETEDNAPTSSDGDWEKPSVNEEDVSSEPVSQVEEEAQAEQEEAEALEASLVAPKSAKVLSAAMSFGNSEDVFDFPEARVDVSAEFAGLTEQYPNVNQAFRMGRIAILHDEARALAQVVVANDGALPWPELSVLRSVAGPAYNFPELQLGAVPVGDAVEFNMDLSFGSGQPGEAVMSGWAMVDEHGEPFGPLLLLEVTRV